MSTPLTSLSEDELMFQQAVRDWARKEIAPHVSAMDHEGKLAKHVISGAFELGLMGIEVPGKFDGSESSFFTAILAIEELAASRGITLPVLLEIDCGGGRSGVDPASDIAQLLVRRLADAESIDFRGLLTHAGHAYLARSRSEAYEVACEERNLMNAFATEVRDLGVVIAEVSVGSTPTLRAIDDLTGITEARPGNYLFNDFFQSAIGSCDLDDVAFSVLATVISVDTEQGRAVVDAGALALSKDPGPTHVDSECGYGLPVTLADQHPLPGLRLVGLTQEHGSLIGPGVAALKPGTRLRILPNHSCLSAACFDSYDVVRGSEIVDEWHPVRGW